MTKNWGNRLLPLIGPAILFVLWQTAVSAKWLNPVLLPSPVETLRYLFEALVSGGMNQDIGATLYRTMMAFVFSAVIGVPLGVILGSNERVYRSVEFLVDFFRSTPSSAMIPLFMLIFGITDANKIAIAAFAAVLVILFNSAYGVMNAKKTRIMAAHVMGVPRWHIFKDIMLMESLPQTFVGLRTGVSMALVIVIVAEMFIGSETGLGHRIIDAQQLFNIKDMYASILLTGAFGYLLNLAFLLIEKRCVHWSGKA
ncbi:NitT/TauT family transport system permease protein [Gibbsiella quercinecans]|uniref:Taurine ABC transporter permease n=2 Tax=Gibbsiella TaxID=929812 RepID=A0A250B181_9GAMM|nr:ABC transporter permease [Gibbsiella quercinecans]ATA19845.1 taurine ABC transporter permease [Gibbsiella quercinecans]RLM10165.1 taurine ABC transporter permease [Gibbsiella quercinecans]RLM12616.1 taurine ABC transporter permease [Gibbsiella quercinecans]RLM16251.1 taurine ABC transporter permease [Gibbsiella quercinecans]TCT89712.1 NitT/TauT family transport system permease protein [Gibbsiella quercinecans]